MFICLWIKCFHPPVKLASPLQGGGENSQGGGENFRLASLAICHPPDQNAETASALSLSFILKISYPPKLSKLEVEIGKNPTHSDYKLDFKYFSASSFIY